MRVPLTKPYFDDREPEAAARVVRSGMLCQGPEVAALEDEVGDRLGARVVACSSGTSALHLVLRALGIGSGCEVICPSYTFVATVNAVLRVGAFPVLADICEDTYNLDPEDAARRGTSRTVAILAVDQVGLPCDLRRLSELADHRRIALVEDAACALGASWGAGSVGAGPAIATTFSLHGSKAVVCGEGGLIALRDPDGDWIAERSLAAKIRRLRDHGCDRSASDRQGDGGAYWQERYVDLGYNDRMTDVAAAIARVQVGKLDEIVRLRRERAARYNEAVAGMGLIPPVEKPDGVVHAYQRYLVRFPTPAFPIGPATSRREAAFARMREAGVDVRRGIQVVHREPYWLARFGARMLPVTERVADTSLQLPLYPSMTDDEQGYVVEKLREALR